MLSCTNRFVRAGVIDHRQSSIHGQGIKLQVTACTAAHVIVTARDRWANVQTDRIEHVLGIIVGGGAENGSALSVQETIMVHVFASLVILT